MSQDSRFYASCGGAIFFLLGGVYLVGAIERTVIGEAFIVVGGVLFLLALHLGVKPTER